MPAFSQRCPYDLHQAMRAWLNDRPWLNQTELVNGALSAMIGYPDYRIDTAPPTLADYLRSGAINEVSYNSLRSAIARGQLIGIFGPHQSGRTALLRALIQEYQTLGGSPRRAMVVSTVAGELKKCTPLLALTLTDETMRSKALGVPDFIEPVFADDLSDEAMSGAVEAWKKFGGAFTRRGGDIFGVSADLNAQVAVRVLMDNGKIVMLLDNLPHENTPEKIERRFEAQTRADDMDSLFDEIVAHYESENRLVRRGPNSGRSPESMTKRASIRDGDGSIGTLEIATTMLSAGIYERRIAWTSNTIAPSPRGSVEHEIKSFEEAAHVVG